MTEYQEIRTHIPPTLARENGALVIRVMHGNTTVVAPLGDGAAFFGRLVEELINPALRAAATKENDYASPND